MNTSDKTSIRLKRLRLLTRVFSGGVIGIAFLFALGHILFPEPTVEDYPWVENLLPILLLFSVIALATAFRWETLGGALSLAFFILQLLLFWVIRGHFFPLFALLPLLPVPIAAALFILLGRMTVRDTPST